MAKREIINCSGRDTGERIAQFVWRSKPTSSPHTGRAVRCIVAQDEKGQYWPGTRIGPAKGGKAEYEFWTESSTKPNEAIAVAREHTREFVGMEAELYSENIKGKKPGEQIVKVSMDDGWSVAINAPEKPPLPTPGFSRLMKMLDGYGSNKKSPQKCRLRPRGRGIDR